MLAEAAIGFYERRGAKDCRNDMNRNMWPAIGQDVARLLLTMPRPVKRAVAILVDMMNCALAMLIGLYLRLGFLPMPTRPLVLATLVSISLCVFVFWSFQVYRSLLRHLGAASIAVLASAIVLYAVPFAGLFTFYGFAGVPRTLGLLQPTILFLLVVGSRAAAVSLLQLLSRSANVLDNPTNVLIYGAGSAGRQLGSALRLSSETNVRGYIDDDADLVGQKIDDRPVYDAANLADVVAERKITHILLAIPSATRRRRNEIIESLRSLPVRVQTLPGMMDLAHGRVEISDLHDLEIEDLLGRGRVEPDQELLERNVLDRIVMVTGAGGSIGSELSRQILSFNPRCLLLVEHSEYALYQIHQDLIERLAQSGGHTQLVPLLASIGDESRIGEIMHRWQPYTVFHSAAYKHVPLVEQNAIEGIRNNVLGTLNIALAAGRHGVSHFVLISTDKAVRPTSVMGATKRLAELVLQGLAADGARTCYAMVRFGNVLGSSGSVVPLFRKQLMHGGPITITHREMTRYFMLIPEAAQLVIQAGAMAKGGEVFLLDMSEPVRIVDLARNMIELSGLTVRGPDNPDGEIEIRETGLRPGEKLYEELLIDANASPTDHPLIMKAREDYIAWQTLRLKLDMLAAAVGDNQVEAALDIIADLVPEYQDGRRADTRERAGTP